MELRINGCSNVLDSFAIMLKLFFFAVLLGGLSEICAEHSIVKKSGHSGPPYPLWHLEPLYVKALPAKTEEKRETPGGGESQSQVEETHAVLTDIDGQRTGVQQQIQKGEVEITDSFVIIVK